MGNLQRNKRPAQEEEFTDEQKYTGDIEITMVNKVLEYVKKYRMIEQGDTIVAGVSGGADSVCLLFVLMELQKQLSFGIRVVHVNHGIRPEAGKDACFVQALCDRYGIAFELTEENVREKARQNGVSEEEEGRRIRYQAFEAALGTDKGKIAVAHNSNDRAETMLFHLFRGTGLAGMTSIPPRSGNVIRPLLCLKRSEIEKWLQERKITFCNDSTNEQDIYTRNRIRHHILSYAEQEICRGTVEHMNRTAEQLSKAEEYICRQTQEAMRRCTEIDEKTKKAVVRISALLNEDEYLQGRILLNCVERVAGCRKNITAAHIRAVEELFKKTGSREINLPYGTVVYKEYDLGMIQRKDRENGFRNREEYRICIPSVQEVPGLGKVEFTVFPGAYSQNIPEKTYTKWFDYDKITSALTFRTRRAGDYLTINSQMGRKSLQDYFVNEKVPKQERDQIYLLTEQEHVVWIPGYRISQYYKVSADTENILQVSILDKER